MDKYPRMFIISSVIYLLIGTLMGVMMASHALDPQFRFVHIHLNLFGFMAMMVFGVAYHILPRFMGKTIKFPVLVPIHFYCATIGLVGMVIAYLAGGYTDTDAVFAEKLFAATGGFSTLAVILFAVNIIPVLLMTKRKAIQPLSQPSSTEAVPKKEDESSIRADMKIGEILERKPDSLSIFIDAGFKALADPIKRKAMGEKMVLKTACQIRGVNLDDILNKLNGIATSSSTKAAPTKIVSKDNKGGLSLKRGELVLDKTPVGHMIEVYPETKIVLERNYGGECFSCPGMAIETIEQTANMHNRDPEEILGEINLIVREIIGKK